MDDDERWRRILRGLNQTFGRQTVTDAQVWQTAELSGMTAADFRVDENFYVTTRNADPPGGNP